jgi:non-ribosomal peptide synthetase component F
MLLCVCAQSASVVALAALVNKDKLTLFDLVCSALSEIVFYRASGFGQGG